MARACVHGPQCMQVWTFSLLDVEFKLNQAGSGSMAQAVTMNCDTSKVVVVDSKLAADPS